MSPIEKATNWLMLGAVGSLVTAVIVGAALAGCPSPAPPAPVPVPPDATDAATPQDVALCQELAAAGCRMGNDPGCPSTLEANKVPGGYLAPWAVCLFSGAPVASCHVPCGP